MTTSQTSFLAEILSEKASIPEAKLAYFRERQKNRLFSFIVGCFQEKEQSGFLRADLARRINKKPEQITRWLANPSNWTLDTISDLMLALCGAELEFAARPLRETLRNSTAEALLHDRSRTIKTSTSSANTAFKVFYAK